MARFNPYRMFTGVFIPDPVLEHQAVSVGAKICYGLLARFAGANGQCWPSQETLAKKLSVSDRQVRTYLGELEDAKFIESDQRGLGMSNTYWFLDDNFTAGEPETIDQEQPTLTGTKLPFRPEECFRSDRKDASAKEIHSKRVIEEQHSEHGSSEEQYSEEEAYGDSGESPFALSPENGNGKAKKHSPTNGNGSAWKHESFEEFWSICWAKIGKGAARAAWLKKVKGKQHAAEIIAAAKRQGPALREHAKANGHSVLHPSTWLNQERWEDDPDDLSADSSPHEEKSNGIPIYNDAVWMRP